MLRPPIAPMLARLVPELPGPDQVGGELLVEPKFDGFRVVAFCLSDRVYLQSRAGRNLTGFFPDIGALLRRWMPTNVVVDGELLVWDPDRGRTSFAQMQRRLTAGRGLRQLAAQYPATLVAFDLLQTVAGRSLLSRPLTDRRAQLAELLASAPSQLSLCPQTTSRSEARQWLIAWTDLGVEGLVGKRPTGKYTPGKRGWLKAKTRRSSEAIIAGVTGSVSTPETLLLGRFDAHGRLRFVGRSHPLATDQQRELASVLSRAWQRRRGGIDHPWPQPLPAGWSGHFQKPQPLPYVQVEPTVVVEVRADTAMDRHRWRHPVHYLRPLAGLSVYDVPLIAPDDP
ncbi:ATP-dependent DNA ligase [Actinomycetes bacterium KLBMP 9797]